MIVCAAQRHVEKMFADSEYKWGPISTERERERERKGGWERERNGSSPRPVLYHKERERRRVRIGRNVLGAPPAVVLDAVVK